MGAAIALERPPGRLAVWEVLGEVTGRSHYHADEEELEPDDDNPLSHVKWRRAREPIEVFWARQRERAWDKPATPCGAGTHPGQAPPDCYLAGQPHQHCRCGLPITLVQLECSTCNAERERRT